MVDVYITYMFIDLLIDGYQLHLNGNPFPHLDGDHLLVEEVDLPDDHQSLHVVE